MSKHLFRWTAAALLLLTAVCLVLLILRQKKAEPFSENTVAISTSVSPVDTETTEIRAPETEAPVTEAPVAEVPVTEVPVTEVPVTEVPVTETPVTETPVTEAPVTEAPVTEAPVTETPVTEMPVTEAPVTEPRETEAPEPSVRHRALALLAGMTEREKLCQLMIVSPDTITGVSPTRRAGDISRQALEQYPVGGFSFSQENLNTRDQVSSMLAGFNSYSKIPMFFCLDEEGGTVWRVMKNPELGTTRIGSMFDYRDQGPETAYSNARTIAADIAGLGFNVDFAPVADVWTNPDNTVIGKRAYSDSFAQAAELIPAAVAGFHDGGVACTLKHFPGHGDTVTDSHKGLPVVNRSVDALRAGELLPFRAGLEAGADLVMVGHLLLTELDPEYPATLSPAVVTGLLRQELGFDGVVITDSLGMGALNAYGEGRKCVLALQAGCDILLGVQNVPRALEALEQALAEGELSWDRVEQSVLRILELKLRRGIAE